MSIVAYYARLSSAQLSECANNPEALISGDVSHFTGAEVIDIDRSWEPIAWLVSPCKRAEHEHNDLVMREDMKKHATPKPSFITRITGLFKRSKQGSELPQAIKDSLLKVDAMPIDLPLIAIEGRSDNYDERFNFGIGAAAFFSPDQVKKLQSSLAPLTVETLEQKYDPELMDELGVFPAHWVDEGRELLENYVYFNFSRLQSFYADAAKNNQVILMWYA